MLLLSLASLPKGHAPSSGRPCARRPARLSSHPGCTPPTERADRHHARYSFAQAVRILLLWFFEEWSLGPELGFPYFEYLFVKNPNEMKLRHLIRETVMSHSSAILSAALVSR